MKKLLSLSLTALAVLSIVSCKKDNPGYGVDGKTPLPQAVDIGVVVNGKTIKWASCNLGASKEYEYGNYYAWGETDPKADYSEDTYTFDIGSNTILPLSNDAAHVHLGGGWRMPTLEELNALLSLKNDKDHYTWEKWASVTDGKGNTIYGLRITQKSSGKSIFFPAAGCASGTEIGAYAGSWGGYWTSSLITESAERAAYLYLYSSGSMSTSYSRHYGCPVRPVSE